jgi:hypothetical protein
MNLAISAAPRRPGMTTRPAPGMPCKRARRPLVRRSNLGTAKKGRPGARARSNRFLGDCLLLQAIAHGTAEREVKSTFKNPGNVIGLRRGRSAPSSTVLHRFQVIEMNRASQHEESPRPILWHARAEIGNSLQITQSTPCRRRAHPQRTEGRKRLFYSP